MAPLGRKGFLAIAVIFHVVYIYSIFDIYFVSPIVSGMKAHKVEEVEAPAKRLVLIVGDGLRADKAFQSFPDPSPSPHDPSPDTPRPLMPFLRSRVLHHGTFGVSHTRVPTESRPGHVALIAGLYEDVSAVTTGWKLNPVNFDSVFNRSRHTWSWGSPDILPMFKEGAVPGRVDADMYTAEAEDFTADATALDTWVFERVDALFSAAKTNATLNAALREDRLVFFLHLLGLDTTGHGFRPYSKEYLHNIKVVDAGLKRVTALIDNFYNDGKTAYIFTADHGMSDWGSHGDGHPDNTRTPLVAWGSGVAPPVLSAPGSLALGHEDGFSADWGFDQVARHDVAQADVAALMTYLAGLEFPVNSVGELPLAYVSADAHKKASALLVNARAILEMYRVKEAQKRGTQIRFVPFGEFDELGGGVAAEAQIRGIQGLIQEGRCEEAIAQMTELMRTTLQGLRYLQTYDWLFLRTLVTAGFLGWIAFAATTVVDLHVLHGGTAAQRSVGSVMFFSSALVAIAALLAVQRSSWTYYAYAVFPVAFWEEVYARRASLRDSREVLLGHLHGVKDYLRFLLRAGAFVGILEALVQSYFYREIYTICYILAAAWPAFYGAIFLRQNRSLCATWAASCILMSGFTILPAIKTEDLTLILIGGTLMFAVGIIYLLFEKSIIQNGPKESIPSDGLSRIIIGVQVGLVLLAMVVTRSSVMSLQAKQGLPLGTQVVGWIVLVSSLIVPFFHGLRPNRHYFHRLVAIFLAFSPIFIILTISYEGLFYVVFFTTLVTWVRLEHQIFGFTSTSSPPTLTDENPTQPGRTATKPRPSSPTTPDFRSLTLSDARIALFFFYLLQSAFFSTGNMASVSSFSLDAVSRLIPVFDPFSQGALLIFKIMIPFAVISANLGILNRKLGVAPSALFMVVMAVSDVMTLNFFYMVRDEGSWLDIGTTISHFVIASALCVFVAGLEGVSEVFMSGIEFGEEGVVEGNGSLQSKTTKGKENGTIRHSTPANGGLEKLRKAGEVDSKS
ncbi:PigN-domain-containing protein [Eremomyces bilateralis CBS 781.70]|uniref:GPI ethanolamine phosphate transferase 1 n=1 Tax=Eremomyces bilateralis CBS 781.70 TaxID=1392243 RepID=A0A6G1FTX3_9PEZI|nr:PigN-domain-containing protein [Eremomyces bilateralis CBS 781.70]KAF1809247.1 PigN-domain-containing protein [Eremomyces bilateralis CBS 781.70]